MHRSMTASVRCLSVALLLIAMVAAAQADGWQAHVPIVTVQNRLNPFFREALETGVVAHCAQEGIGFLAYSPVGGGRLNKKLPQIEALRPIAAAHGATPHAVVLAWVLAQGPTVIVIPGARTVEHATDSAAAAHLVLSPVELASIDAAEFSRA